jgi:Acetyltransferase (GNAT) domain
MNSSLSPYKVQIYRRVAEVDPKAWYGLIDAQHDLAMDLRLIALMEDSLSDQARFWTVVISDERDQCMACACLALFRTDVVQSAAGFLQKMVQRLRSRWPHALTLSTLFCGLPLPSGHSHWRVSQSADYPTVLSLLNQTLLTIARQEKAQLVVIKELDEDEVRQTSGLRRLRFFCGELEPIYRFSRVFKDFSAYQSALRSGYRRQVQLNIKKFKQLPLQVEHLHDPEEISERFTEAVYQLYLNVWARAKEKLECFPRAFFGEAARKLPGQVSLTLISHGQQPIAFAMGIAVGAAYHNLYIGLDYAYNDQVDLYFNLFYQELDEVFQRQKTQIWLGQTSGAFKSRLGAVPDSRFFWVRPLNPALWLIFKCFQKFIFPAIKKSKENQVFIK